MDNHPIPQDITGFKFKLIGQMTIKQLIYAGSGFLIAFVMFYFLSLPGYIKWLVMIISSITGVAFAFLPVSGRPMDVMLGNFISALFSPTKYVYRREGAKITKANVSQMTEQAVIQLPGPGSQQSSPTNLAFQKTEQPAPAPQPKQTDKKEDIIKSEKKLEEKQTEIIEKLEQSRVEEKNHTNIKEASETHKNQEELEKMLNETVRQKEELEKQLALLQGKLSAQKQTFTPPVTTAPKITKNVKQAPNELKKEAGTTNMPQDPNIITGIVKDSRGNPLPNILVEVNDSERNPVRAFKTNGLGQFASATPLQNGKYQISFEDPKGEHRFDAVEVEIRGEMVMPLEIISIDAREELRRELFN